MQTVGVSKSLTRSVTTSNHRLLARMLISGAAGLLVTFVCLYPLPLWARSATQGAMSWLPSWLLPRVPDFPPSSRILLWLRISFWPSISMFVVSYGPGIAFWVSREGIRVVRRSGPDVAALLAWALVGAVSGGFAGLFVWAQWSVSHAAISSVATGATVCGLVLPVLRCWAREQMELRATHRVGAA